MTNSDGIAPASKLVLGQDGNLYGTTQHGGAYGAGSVFRVSTNGVFSNLYSFSPATNSSGATVYSLSPNDLAQGADANLYGTTRSGGSHFSGTIFVLTPSGSFSNLYTFGAETAHVSGQVVSLDGATPTGALVQGNDGNFYGTTEYGGTQDGGTIFQLTPGGAFASLYSFPKEPINSATTNGTVPNPLALGNDGAFYGATQQGGVANAGTFFRFTVAGGWTQIFSFNGAAPGSNPITPNGALVQDSNGYFYGTSVFGGSQGGGTVFEITNMGHATLIYSFPQLNAGVPSALTLGADGNFYGTTAANGLGGEGTLFRITPQGDYGAYAFSGLDTNAKNAYGANPSAALTAGGDGYLYGTCAAGGTNGSGVIFQLFEGSFNPPSFLSTANPPPTLTNVLVGASVTLSHEAQGGAPLSYQWLRNGTNLTDGGDIVGSLTNVLMISPVFPRDIGSYSLVISNTWGALTSAVTVLTITPPSISISSPAPNASIDSPVFAGTAANAPVFTNANPSEVRLTNVFFSIANILSGSNVTGTALLSAGSGGASNWSFTATPFPGTNILSVQCVDAAGDFSPAVSRTFFYETPAALTILTHGSGTGAFTLSNGAMLNIGQSYSITVRPNSSVFSNWVDQALVSYDPTLSFVMQSNLVLTANLMARQPPTVFISSPAANERGNSTNFAGAAQSSPLLPGVNPENVRLTKVEYWLTNTATGSVLNGLASLTPGPVVSNWFIAVRPLPGTNILAIQCQDASGGVSRIESRTFFYTAPSVFSLYSSGNGSGTFTSTASVAGDTPPANGAKLNLGESYTITARPDAFSTFSKWVSSARGVTSDPTLSFTMQPGLVLTAVFEEIAPVVTISSPVANSRSTEAPEFAGTASGHLTIAKVLCSLANTNGSATLTAGARGVSNWSISLAPAPGANVLTVYCVDTNGNRSETVSRKFFYEVPSPLRVITAGTGFGTFKGVSSSPGGVLPANGAMLDLNETYKITALPGGSSLFSNWVGTVGNSAVLGSDTAALSFVMQSNLVLTATFITNFFPGVAGTYNGLFFSGGAVREETSGMLDNLVLMKTGAFSGKLLTAGTNYPVASKFDASGQAAFAVGPLQVSLALDTAARQLTGTVSGSAFSAHLTAELAGDSLPSSEYTVLLSPPADVPSNSPPGDGCVLITNHAGIATLSGTLADGTRYNQIVPISRSGDIPVYADLYAQITNTHAGLLAGWINLTNLQAAPPSNALVWIKKSFPSPPLYTNGFTNILSVLGSLWTNDPDFLLTNGSLTVSNAGLFLSFTNIVVNDDTLANAGAFPTNTLTGSINPKTGLLTLSFGNGHGGASSSASAAILQNTTRARGFFLTSSNAGSIILGP